MASWSFSAYTMAHQCLQKYKFSFLESVPAEGPETGDLLFGTVLHSALHAQLIGLNAPELFALYWDTYQNKEVEYGRYNWDALRGLGEIFLRKFAAYHAKHHKLEFAEQRLYAEYKGIKLEGTPDFYGQYRGRSSLRDFKTSSRNYAGEKADCALQLYIYAYLWQGGGHDLPATLGYTVFNKSTGSIQDLTWELDEKKMLAALDDLVNYVSIWATQKDLYPRNLGACLDYNRPCQYFSRCHGGQPNGIQDDPQGDRITVIKPEG